MSYRLVFEPAAEDGYAKIPAGLALDRVDAILDELEEDPGRKRLRKHRYILPAVFGVDFTAAGEDWMLLWSIPPGTERIVIVHYIGPVPCEKR